VRHRAARPSAARGKRTNYSEGRSNDELAAIFSHERRLAFGSIDFTVAERKPVMGYISFRLWRLNYLSNFQKRRYFLSVILEEHPSCASPHWSTRFDPILLYVDGRFFSSQRA
jgi:hypothetical protein